MRDGKFEGKGLDHPKIRALFAREQLLDSDWYAARLEARQAVEIRLWRRHVDYLEQFLTKSNYASEAERLGLADRLALSQQKLAEVKKRSRLKRLVGTLGTDPSVLRTHRQVSAKRSAMRVARTQLPGPSRGRRRSAVRGAPVSGTRDGHG
jgi:hypothetical protein